jgi:prophage regulatory protein
MNPSTPTFSVRGLRILRERQVVERTGLSRSTLWRLERRGHFPARRRIAPGAVGWLESEIDEYLSTCPSSVHRAQGGGAM